MQGMVIAVVYTLRAYWNQFSPGGICKQNNMHQCYPRRIKAFNFVNFDNSHNSFLWPEYFIDFFMWKMDPMSGCNIRLVFTLPPRDSSLQYKRCVHLWNNFPCIITFEISWSTVKLQSKCYRNVCRKPQNNLNLSSLTCMVTTVQHNFKHDPPCKYLSPFNDADNSVRLRIRSL